MHHRRKALKGREMSENGWEKKNKPRAGENCITQNGEKVTVIQAVSRDWFQVILPNGKMDVLHASRFSNRPIVEELRERK
jgi:hypothetical protein